MLSGKIELSLLGGAASLVSTLKQSVLSHSGQDPAGLVQPRRIEKLQAGVVHCICAKRALFSMLHPPLADRGSLIPSALHPQSVAEPAGKETLFDPMSSRSQIFDEGLRCEVRVRFR